MEAVVCAPLIEVGCEGPPEASRATGGISDVIVFLVGNDRERLVARKEVFVKRCLHVDACMDWHCCEGQQDDIGKPTIISLPSLTRAGMEHCLQYVQTGGCEISRGNLWDVFDAAVFLNLRPIATTCVPHILENLNTENAWRGLENGLLLGSRDLIEEALRISVESLGTVLENTDVKADWITSGALLKVLKRKDLAVKETKLAEKVLQWADATQESKETVRRVMQLVSWAVIYEEDTELFKRAVEKGVFPPGLVNGGTEEPLNVAVKDMPESMRLRYYRAFVLHPSDCSSYSDVGPVQEHGDIEWMSFEGAPHSNGLRLNYDGRLEVPDPNGRLNATKDFSVEVWVKHDFMGEPHEGPIACKAGMGCGWELRTSNYMVQFLVTLRNRNGDQWHELVGIRIRHDPERWYHLVGTFDGEAVLLYVNGSLDGMSRLQDWNTRGGDHRTIEADCEIAHFDGALCIGQHSHDGWRHDRDFQGDICGLSIFNNRVLKPTES